MVSQVAALSKIGEFLIHSTYLITELAIMTMVLLMKPRGLRWSTFLSWRYLAITAGLFFFWLVLDLIALALGLWYFPEGGTFPVRILGLPLEEYGIFLIHTFVCTVFLKIMEK